MLRSVFSGSVLSNVWFSNLYKRVTNGTIALDCVALKRRIAAGSKVLSCFCNRAGNNGERERWNHLPVVAQLSGRRLGVQSRSLNPKSAFR